MTRQSSGDLRRESAKACLQVEMRFGEWRYRPLLGHCERSEVIQTPWAAKLWVAAAFAQASADKSLRS